MSPPSVVGLLGSEITVLHAEAGAAYLLLRWRTPAGAPSPPLHLHRRTDEGFYVLQGALCLLIEDETRVHGPGEFALVRRGQRHSFWNPGEEAAVYLTFISPAGFEAYFAELSSGLARAASKAEVVALRDELSTRHDIEVGGPPPFSGTR